MTAVKEWVSWTTACRGFSGPPSVNTRTLKRRRTLLSLEALEGRLAPATYTVTGPGDAGTDPATAASPTAAHVMAAPYVPASVVFDFTGFTPTTPVEFAYLIRYTGPGRFSPSQPIAVTEGTSARGCAVLMYNSLPKSTIVGGKHTEGFDVTLDPTGPIVTVGRYWDAGGNPHEVTLGKTYVEGTKLTIKGGFTPKTGTPPGGGGGGAPSGTSGSVAFNFAPSDLDGTAALQADATLTAMIDGVMVTLQELAGESYLAVANDLYVALLNQGLTGVQNDGAGDVIFSNDFSGQPVSAISLQLANTNSSDPPVSWFSTGVGQYPY